MKDPVVIMSSCQHYDISLKEECFVKMLNRKERQLRGFAKLECWNNAISGFLLFWALNVKPFHLRQ